MGVLALTIGRDRPCLSKRQKPQHPRYLRNVTSGKPVHGLASLACRTETCVDKDVLPQRPGATERDADRLVSRSVVRSTGPRRL